MIDILTMWWLSVLMLWHWASYVVMPVVVAVVTYKLLTRWMIR